MIFNLLLLLQTSPDNEAQAYLKAAALLTYPEQYLNVFAQLERRVDLYLRFDSLLQAEAGSYVKTAGLLQREIFPYVKFALSFPEPAQRYVKASSTMQARGDMYIRAFAQFVMHADYIKVRAALSRQPVIGDIGDTHPENKVGLLSRHYLSVASVKKEV